MQQMAGNMGLLNPFVLNQFSVPSGYSPYSQVVEEKKLDKRKLPPPQYPHLPGLVSPLLPAGQSAFLPAQALGQVGQAIGQVGQALGQAPLPVSSPGPDLPLAFPCEQQPAQEEVRIDRVGLLPYGFPPAGETGVCRADPSSSGASFSFHRLFKYPPL